jgi:hypothetical protein
MTMESPHVPDAVLKELVWAWISIRYWSARTVVASNSASNAARGVFGVFIQ